MTKTTTETNEAILRLKEKLAGQPKRKDGGLVRVSVDLRSEALALWARCGLTRPALAEQLGINTTSLYNWEKWRAKSNGQKKKGVLAKGKFKTAMSERPLSTLRVAKFKRVEVTATSEPRDGVADGATSSKLLALELGSGARVTGLSLADVAYLIGLGAR